IARHAVAQTKLGVAEHLLVLHEPLVDQTPRDGRRGEEARLVVRTEPAGTFGAAGEGEEVAVAEVVVRAAEPREQRPVVVAEGRGLRLGTRAESVDPEETLGEQTV